MPELTNKQRIFIEEYLTCWNATEAAKRAGYSERSACSIGAENLTKPDVAEAIRQRIAERTMSADEVLVRLTEQARGDMGDFLDGKTYGRPVITLDRAQGKTHLIKRYTTGPQGTSIELYDAQAALEKMGKHYKLFTDVSEVKQETTHDLTESLISRLSKRPDKAPDRAVDQGEQS